MAYGVLSFFEELIKYVNMKPDGLHFDKFNKWFYFFQVGSEQVRDS